ELTGKIESAQELPVAYQMLKYNLIRTTTYGDPKLLSQVEHILDQVLDNYYDDLPQGEQFIIDIIQSSIYVYTSGDKSYGKSLF
ncbi:transcriptional regulator, partial [Streptococcus gordonii]|nr:transcriptional regulator [Streptococcus gordonii]